MAGLNSAIFVCFVILNKFLEVFLAFPPLIIFPFHRLNQTYLLHLALGVKVSVYVILSVFISINTDSLFPGVA